MAKFEKEWDAETAKQGTFTAKKPADVASVALKRRSGDGLEAKLVKLSVNEENFKWTATSDTFSFNFEV